MDKPLKDVVWLGDSLEVVRGFPKGIREDLGEDIYRLQAGALPRNSRPMKTVGRGVHELRARDRSGQYRTIYAVRKQEGVYVLHAFQKKSTTTSKRDIETAKRRLREI